jgi:hypothetical protein
LTSADLEQVFRACFLASYRTVLVGGGNEPLYLPSDDPERSPHRVIYREDYVASALHEVAHWCVAGAARRRLEDYGYWYVPDGRSPEQQARFEQVEVAPQAIEWIFSDAARLPFHLSADNLSGGLGSSDRFERAVRARRRRYLEEGLPPRAEAFRRALGRVTVRSGADRAASPR